MYPVPPKMTLVETKTSLSVRNGDIIVVLWNSSTQGTRSVTSRHVLR